MIILSYPTHIDNNYNDEVIFQKRLKIYFSQRDLKLIKK